MVIEEIREESLKFLVSNENENMTYQTFRTQQRQCYEESLYCPY
jgi:hypothetical protein